MDNFGVVEFFGNNDKPKLTCKVNGRVKFDITPFNAGYYLHLTSRAKTISISYREFEELLNLKSQIDASLPLLDLVSITIIVKLTNVCLYL